jgi:dipeptidyl aminopeptidase/acylaminoacyl peptidase
MEGKKIAAYGAWSSPITAELVAKQSVRFGDLFVDGDDIYWSESRPSEKGRSVIVRCKLNGKAGDVIPAPFSARSRVHEYGGGAFAVSKGVLYFVNFDDQRIYRKDAKGVPHALTPSNGSRYADLIIDEARNRLICVQETSLGPETVNSIVSIDLAGTENSQTLISGSDFFSSPRLSPNRKHIAWLSWNHPNMPWDGTELWVADIDESGSLINHRKAAGGVAESIFQPEWSPDNVLFFVSDRSDWWNIYRYNDEGVEPVVECEAEFAMPQWAFGLSTYGFIDENRIACTFNNKGFWQLATISTGTRKLQLIETAYNDIAHLRILNEWIIFYGGSPIEDLSLIMYNTATAEKRTIRRRQGFLFDPQYFSEPQFIEFDTTDDKKAYGFFYPPKNRDYSGPEDELPPLIVVTHGGPTSCSYASLDPKIQFWTSRGFAVFDVNYGGSTGFGRAYRERLKGKWGIVDVDDCVNGARYLVENNKVDGAKLIIRGGSAGGYTTLAALTFRKVFKAGASYYGVSDLEALTRETHKFESRYLDSLVGPYPEARKTYRERSPIDYIERLSTPIIFFQGLEDKVVPPNQAEKMVSALRKSKIPVAYIAFEGEQHGFRRGENLKRSLEAELYFYSRIFGFELSERIRPVHIENL